MGNDTSSWTPNITAFLKVLSLHWFCSTCTPTTWPVTRAQKFIYTDDICLATQGQYFSKLVGYGADVTLLSTVAT